MPSGWQGGELRCAGLLAFLKPCVSMRRRLIVDEAGVFESQAHIDACLNVCCSRFFNATSVQRQWLSFQRLVYTKAEAPPPSDNRTFRRVCLSFADKLARF